MHKPEGKNAKLEPRELEPKQLEKVVGGSGGQAPGDGGGGIGDSPNMDVDADPV